MIRRVAQFLTLATMFVFTLAAQRGPGGFGPMDNMGATQDPVAGVTRRVEFLTALLTLTTNQVSQATTVFTNEAAAITPLQTSMQTARESLQAAVKANNTATIDQLSSQIGTLTGQITAAHSKADAAFYALLTADQKTRYDAMGGGRGRGPGGPGGGFGH